MPELLRKRPRLAVLSVLAVVASVLAAGAPVAAEPGKADGAAEYSACVGPATVDAGFTDVAAGSTHDAAIDCIAYYGITSGTSASTFSPNRTIPRWQLAVMLARAAGPAGVTLPEAASQGFTDISELGASFQAAVNQMAAMGIMAGTTATTFDPDGIVSRTTIVEALAGFLTSARVGPGGKALTRNADRSLTLKAGTGANAATIAFDESFRDIGVVTFSAYQAIRALAEMGVVSGRGDGTFGPLASVTRGQAASFITRALAHTNARPAGLTVQANKSAVTSADELSLIVSVRGSDFSPRESVSVDVFSHVTAGAAGAFKPDGTCQTTGSTRVTVVGSGTVACVIEVDDDVTEPSGNVRVDVDTPTQPTTFWAWTGSAGDKLDWDEANLSMDDSMVSDAASLSVTISQAPASAKVSLSVPADATGGKTVRYGTTVTVTIQLVDSAGKDVAASGHAYQWWATGSHDPAGPGRAIPGTGTQTVTTGADGSASFTLTQDDPDTDATGGEDDSTTWTYNIVKLAPNGVDLADTAAIGFTVTSGTGTGEVIFDDADPDATKLSIEIARLWSPLPTGGAPGRVGVTAKVTDQYGAPMRGQPVFFDFINNANGCAHTIFGGVPHVHGCGSGDTDIDDTTGEIPGTVRRLTRSNGTNTVSADFRAMSKTENSVLVYPVTDTFARYAVATDLNGDGDVGDDDERAVALHTWAANPAGWNADTGMGVPVARTAFRRVDLAGNAMIIGGSTVFHYSADDIFIWSIDDTGGVRPGWAMVRWLDMAEFERRMTEHLKPRAAGHASTDLFVLQMSAAVHQYNTKTGRSVFEVMLDESLTDLYDPPAPG